MPKPSKPEPSTAPSSEPVASVDSPKADTLALGDHKWTEEETGLKVANRWYPDDHDWEIGQDEWYQRRTPKLRRRDNFKETLARQSDMFNSTVEWIVRQGYDVTLTLQKRLTITTSDSTTAQMVVPYKIVAADMKRRDDD